MDRGFMLNFKFLLAGTVTRRRRTRPCALFSKAKLANADEMCRWGVVTETLGDSMLPLCARSTDQVAVLGNT